MSFPKSKKYLQEAITGETGAIRKYRTFAEIAEKEGFPNIAYLFRSLIKGEQIHIRNHKNALEDQNYTPKIIEGDVGTTIENVKAAIEGEMHEYTSMYPNLIKEIKSETKKEFGKVTRLSFVWAKDVELAHAEALKLAFHALTEGRDFDVEDIYICRVCGNVLLSTPKEYCPVCGHDIRFYDKIERKNKEA